MNAPALILEGDCLATLARLPDCSIDSIVTDPPYGLGREPDAVAMLRDWLAGETHDVGGSGFMGQKWDAFVPGPRVWAECLRVLKPGGHLLAFAGSRTVDLMGLAIRIGGFEVRDQIQWLYGTGFPKSVNVAKRMLAEGDGDPCVEIRQQEQYAGLGTALKPAHEPIILARKPLSGTIAATVLEHGTGALHIDACRIGTAGGTAATNFGETAGQMFGGGAGKPTNDIKTLNAGRWPANVILDPEAGAVLDEQSGAVKGQQGRVRGTEPSQASAGHVTGTRARVASAEPRGDSGGASRFFYCAKTSRAEREAGLEHMRMASAGELTGGREEGSAGLKNPRAGAGRTSAGRANVHPTVKPIALMRWLVRLITPPGGRVLDPFAGSGTTGCAAVLEGFPFLGCELSPEYAEIARARIKHWTPKS